MYVFCIGEGMVWNSEVFLISLFHQAEVAKRMLNRLLDLFSALLYKMRVNLI